MDKAVRSPWWVGGSARIRGCKSGKTIHPPLQKRMQNVLKVGLLPPTNVVIPNVTLAFSSQIHFLLVHITRKPETRTLGLLYLFLSPLIDLLGDMLNYSVSFKDKCEHGLWDLYLLRTGDAWFILSQRNIIWTSILCECSMCKGEDIKERVANMHWFLKSHMDFFLLITDDLKG